MKIDDVLHIAPMIPVLVIDETFDPAALAQTLVGAGLPVIEVTLRTPGAAASIKAMAEVPGAIVGAGTVLDERMLDVALDAGARFVVSPGLTDALCAAAIERDVAYLPGVATASDIMRGLALGLDRFKFFPAETSGGLKALNALSGPFADIRFCPTGGITEQSAQDWLAHPAVLSVGGSWVVPPGETDLGAIAARARKAAKLAQPIPEPLPVT